MAVIEVSELTKRYGQRTAVDGVSFTVGDGEIFGILGPNGAGKTTTVECIAGLRRQDSGTIRVLGLDPRTDALALHEQVGVQLQESQLPDKLKVWEALDLYSSFYQHPADTDELIERLGLADKRDAVFGKLSGGQKQRLSVALALIGRPKIALLDELTTGLDPNARREVWELISEIRASGVTIVLVTHFMEEAERLCDQVAVIDAGHVVAIDSPAGLADRVQGEQRIRFHLSQPLDERLLADLPEVRSVRRDGPQYLISGTGNVVQAVISVLARQGLIAEQLRVDQANLDDAFVALTGHALTAEPHEAHQSPKSQAR